MDKKIVEEREWWCRHYDGTSVTALVGGGHWAWRSLDAVCAATVLARGNCECCDRAWQSVGSVPEPSVAGAAASVAGRPCSPRLTPDTCGTPTRAWRGGRGVRSGITCRRRPCALEAVQSPTVSQVNAHTILGVKSSTLHRRPQNCTVPTCASPTGSSASTDRPARLEHMGSLHQRALLIFLINTTRKRKYVHFWTWRTASPSADQQHASPSRCIRLLQDACACSGDNQRFSSAQRRLHPTGPLGAPCASVLSMTDHKTVVVALTHLLIKVLLVD